jgi:hypothetical protein
MVHAAPSARSGNGSVKRSDARGGDISLRSLQPGHSTPVGICTSGPYGLTGSVRPSAPRKTKPSVGCDVTTLVLSINGYLKNCCADLDTEPDVRTEEEEEEKEEQWREGEREGEGEIESAASTSPRMTGNWWFFANAPRVSNFFEMNFLPQGSPGRCPPRGKLLQSI